MPRTNQNSKKGIRTVAWWVGWITLTIASFFVGAAFWTPFIAKRFGSIHETKTAVIWVACVFGTWMVFLVPLIIFMYQKIDKAYEDARLKRERAENQFRSIAVNRRERLLPDALSKKIETVPETIDGGHLVSLKLRDGRHIPHVFIADRREVLGIYDATEMTFRGTDIQELDVVDMTDPPFFFTANWLRLDGVGPM